MVTLNKTNYKMKNFITILTLIVTLAIANQVEGANATISFKRENPVVVLGNINNFEVIIPLHEYHDESRHIVIPDSKLESICDSLKKIRSLYPVLVKNCEENNVGDYNQLICQAGEYVTSLQWGDIHEISRAKFQWEFTAITLPNNQIDYTISLVSDRMRLTMHSLKDIDRVIKTLSPDNIGAYLKAEDQ